MKEHTREEAAEALKVVRPDWDSGPELLDAIAGVMDQVREQCAVVAQTYGVAGYLEYKDDWTLAIARDTQNIITRAIREGK